MAWSVRLTPALARGIVYLVALLTFPFPGICMAKSGLLAYYDLDSWWESALTPSERQRVESLFHPLGSDRPDPLTDGAVGHIDGATATPAGFLSALLGWLRSTPEDITIRRKMRDKLGELTAVEPNVISRHFALQVLISEYYRDRELVSGALQASIAACRQQIEMAPVVARAMRADFPDQLPRHVGYERLAVILEKNKEYDEAIRVCEEARRSGWNGDWERRAQRCAARRTKGGSDPRGT